MLRTLFLLSLLGLLAAAPATARPARASGWFWFSKPERHGSRKMPGDYRPVYTTYRLHSRERAGRRTMAGNFRPVTASYRHHSRTRRGFFSFLHFGRRPGTSARHHRASTPRGSSSSNPRMTL